MSVDLHECIGRPEDLALQSFHECDSIILHDQCRSLAGVWAPRECRECDIPVPTVGIRNSGVVVSQPSERCTTRVNVIQFTKEIV